MSAKAVNSDRSLRAFKNGLHHVAAVVFSKSRDPPNTATASTTSGTELKSDFRESSLVDKPYKSFGLRRSFLRMFEILILRVCYPLRSTGELGEGSISSSLLHTKRLNRV